MNPHEWRVLILALLVACSACSGNKEEADAADATAPDETALVRSGNEVPPADVEAVRKNLAELVGLIVAEASGLPRAEFDPAALAVNLGKDPQAHFEWVRDNTWWAPYRGLLRGSKGVMLDRVGSSLDRAALLGDLLRKSGHRVRLAHAELPDARVRELLGRIRPIPANRGVASELRAVTVRRKQAAEAVALVRSQAAALLAAVNHVATQHPAEESKAIAALRDHWWVEHEQNGKWIALDVLLPDAKAGEKLAVAASTSNWDPTGDAPAIPESSWHAVRMQVVIERYDAGTTTEVKVLETTFRPAEVLDRPITLAHVPSPWPQDMPFLGAEPDAARIAALAVRRWVPALQIGRDLVVQSGFDGNGVLQPALTDSAAGVVGDQVTSTMDMALGFGGEEAAAAVTAEWIDYDVKAPGEPPQHLRRTVFDLLGPARRAAKFADFVASDEGQMLQRAEALLSQTQILLQPCDFTEAFVGDLVSASIVDNQESLRELSEETDPEKARALLSKILERMEHWGPLPDFGLWRSVLGGNSADWFIDRPNVLNHRISQRLVGNESIALRQLIDVASNGIGARPGAGQKSFGIRVQQGVADTVAEMVTLGSDLEAAANTASVFGRLASANSRGFIIDARDDAAVRELLWPEDETARIAADVGSGYMVFVPRQAVEIDGEQHVAWWRVDPASGETIGVMDSGFHGAAEDAAMANALEALRRKLVVAYLAAGAGGTASGRGLMDLTNRLLQRMDTLIEVYSRSSR